MSHYVASAHICLDNWYGKTNKKKEKIQNICDQNTHMILVVSLTGFLHSDNSLRQEGILRDITPAANHDDTCLFFLQAAGCTVRVSLLYRLWAVCGFHVVVLCSCCEVKVVLIQLVPFEKKWWYLPHNGSSHNHLVSLSPQHSSLFPPAIWTLHPCLVPLYFWMPVMSVQVLLTSFVELLRLPLLPRSHTACMVSSATLSLLPVKLPFTVWSVQLEAMPLLSAAHHQWKCESVNNLARS